MLQMQGAQEQTSKAENDDIIQQAQLVEDKPRLSEKERTQALVEVQQLQE